MSLYLAIAVVPDQDAPLDKRERRQLRPCQLREAEIETPKDKNTTQRFDPEEQQKLVAQCARK